MVWNPAPIINETIIYEGRCERGYAQGIGFAKFYINGELSETWEGNFIDGKLNGIVVVSKKERQSIGEYSNDAFNGRVKFVEKDGTIYEGYTKNGEPHGNGILTWPEGHVYIGQFIDGERTGYGELRTKNSWRYEGNFIKGEINGYGTMYYKNGGKYAGEWRNGKYEGEGFLYDRSGNLAGKGVFSNGVLIRLADIYFRNQPKQTGYIYEAPSFTAPINSYSNNQPQALTPSVLGRTNWINIISPSGQVQGGTIWSNTQPGMIGGGTFFIPGK